MDHIADDVHRDHLNFCLTHQPRDDLQATLINSKGFGGNNATAVALSHTVTESMLTQRHGQQALAGWQQRREAVREAKANFREHCLTHAPAPIYRFNEGVMADEHVSLSQDAVQLQGRAAIQFDDDAGLKDYQFKQ